MKPPPLPEDRPIRIYVADANVLYSRVLRDYLLYAMRARLISVRWSAAILGEMTEHLMENRADFDQDAADRLVRAMTTAFPFAQVDSGPGELAALVGFDLPDDDDRHVIAAALAAEAEFICTHDVGDFPKDVLDALGLMVVTPDDLLCPLIDEHPDSMRWVHQQGLRYLPGSTDESAVVALRKSGSPRAAALMATLLAKASDTTRGSTSPEVITLSSDSTATNQG